MAEVKVKALEVVVLSSGIEVTVERLKAGPLGDFFKKVAGILEDVNFSSGGGLQKEKPVSQFSIILKWVGENLAVVDNILFSALDLKENSITADDLSLGDRYTLAKAVLNVNDFLAPLQLISPKAAQALKSMGDSLGVKDG